MKKDDSLKKDAVHLIQQTLQRSYVFGEMSLEFFEKAQALLKSEKPAQLFSELTFSSQKFFKAAVVGSLLAFSLSACGGKKGSDGDDGAAGPPGPSAAATQLEVKFTSVLGTGNSNTDDIAVEDVNVISKTGADPYDRVLFNLDENAAGGVNKIGVLDDGKAKLLGQSQQTVGDVTNIYKTTTGNKIYLQTSKGLFYYDQTNKRVTHIASIAAVDKVFVGTNVLFVVDYGVGIYEIADGTPTTATERYAAGVGAIDGATQANTNKAVVVGNVLYVPLVTASAGSKMASITAGSNAAVTVTDVAEVDKIISGGAAATSVWAVDYGVGIYQVTNAATPVATERLVAGDGVAADVDAANTTKAVAVDNTLYYPLSTAIEDSKVSVAVAGAAADATTNDIATVDKIVEAKDGAFVIDDGAGIYWLDKDGTDESNVTGLVGAANVDHTKLVVADGTNLFTHKQVLGEGDGTGANVKVASAIAQHTTIGKAVQVGSQLYFGSNNTLWKSDGKSDGTGTEMLGDYNVTSMATDGTDVYFVATNLYKLRVSDDNVTELKGAANASITGVSKMKVARGNLYGVISNDAVYLNKAGGAAPVIVADADANDTVGNVDQFVVLGSGANAKLIVVGAAKLANVTLTTANSATVIQTEDGGTEIIAGKGAIAEDVLFFQQTNTVAEEEDTLWLTRGTTADTKQIKLSGEQPIEALDSNSFQAVKWGVKYYVLIAGKLYDVATAGIATMVEYGVGSAQNLVSLTSGSKTYLFLIFGGELRYAETTLGQLKFESVNVIASGLTKISHPTVVGKKVYFLADSETSSVFPNHGKEWFYVEK